MTSQATLEQSLITEGAGSRTLPETDNRLAAATCENFDLV